MYCILIVISGGKPNKAKTNDSSKSEKNAIISSTTTNSLVFIVCLLRKDERSQTPYKFRRVLVNKSDRKWRIQEGNFL